MKDYYYLSLNITILLLNYFILKSPHFLFFLHIYLLFFLRKSDCSFYVILDYVILYSDIFRKELLSFEERSFKITFLNGEELHGPMVILSISNYSDFCV